MRVLAAIERARGHTVTGSDARLDGHNANNVDGCDLVVYTNAVKNDNCEYIEAKRRGIPLVERADLLAAISSSYKSTIAVSGCHGKSTATAMLGTIFDTATVHVGASGSRIGDDSLFITEACEYNRSFLKLRPDLGVILNIDMDHPDCYASYSEVKTAYSDFGARCKRTVVNGDDEACKSISGIRVGLTAGNDYRATNLKSIGGKYSFDVFKREGTTERKIGTVKLDVEGRHNVYNALFALSVADLYGIEFSKIAAALRSFSGAKRRFENVGQANGKIIICDYAHHPREISASISAAREISDSVAVVFQPHTYTRLQSLFCDFADSLAKADTVILAPVFSAREKPIDGVNSYALWYELFSRHVNAYCFDTFFEIENFCKRLNENLIIFMGAGDIDVACKDALALLNCSNDCS